MHLYRTKSKLFLSTWDEHKLIMLEMTPAVEGAKGQPSSGEIRYDRAKQCIISFSPEEALKCAWYLNKLSNGIDVKYEKTADTSKIVGRDTGEVKKLSIVKSTGANGGAMFNMVSGDKKANIILSYEEVYAIQKYFESKAIGFL